MNEHYVVISHSFSLFFWQSLRHYCPSANISVVFLPLPWNGVSSYWNISPSFGKEFCYREGFRYLFNFHQAKLSGRNSLRMVTCLNEQAEWAFFLLCSSNFVRHLAVLAKLWATFRLLDICMHSAHKYTNVLMGDVRSRCSCWQMYFLSRVLSCLRVRWTYNSSNHLITWDLKKVMCIRW